MPGRYRIHLFGFSRGAHTARALAGLHVGRVRHAVSIDEKRRPYEEYLVLPPEQPGHRAR